MWHIKKRNKVSSKTKIMIWMLLIAFMLEYNCLVNGASFVPIGDVNVLVVTDVHSWVAGRLPHDKTLDADYGDVLSFYRHLKAECDSLKKDLFFVMNGDFMDGTGLSTDPPVELTSIIQQMPWDAINIGNHELYSNSTIEYITQPKGFIEHWRGRYLTSNVRRSAQQQQKKIEQDDSLGNRYRFLYGEFSDSYILTFGFLYNMKDHSPLAIVELVEEVVESAWFQEVLSGSIQRFEAVLVLAHMDVVDPLINVILSAIRTICGPEMPVQFITGHSHRRAYRIIDPYSTSSEAGHYLDTLGFVSFPLNHTLQYQIQQESLTISTNIPTNETNIFTETPYNNNTETSNISSTDTHNNQTHGNDYLSNATNNDTIVTIRSYTNITRRLFQNAFYNANKKQLQTVLNGPPLDTQEGRDLSAFIKNTQQKMGLTRVLGCSPLTYYVDKGLDQIDSLWGLYSRGVIHEQFFKKNESKVFLQNTGSLRYNLYTGEIRETDLISISPFNDTIYLVKESLSGKDFVEAFGEPNHVDGTHYFEELPPFVVVGNIYPDKMYDVYTNEFFIDFVADKISNVTNETSITPRPVQDGSINTGLLWRQFLQSNFTCEKEILNPMQNGFFKSLENFFIEMTWWKILTMVVSVILMCCFTFVFVGPSECFDSLNHSKRSDPHIEESDLSCDSFHSYSSSPSSKWSEDSSIPYDIT